MEDGINLGCEISFCSTWIQGISEVRLLIQPRFKIGAWISTLFCAIFNIPAQLIYLQTVLFCLLTLLSIIMHICL